MARNGRAEAVALGYRATAVPTVVFLSEAVDLGEESTGSLPVRAGDLLLVSISEPSATYALDPATGAEVWRAEEIWMDPPVVIGDLVFGHVGTTITGLDLATGTVRWQEEIELWNWPDPVVVGGIVVTGSEDGRVAGIDPATGGVLWVSGLPRGEVTIWAMAPLADGVVVVDDDLWVTAINADGTERWAEELQANQFEAPVMVGDVLVVSVESGLALVDPATGDVGRTIPEPAPSIDLLPGEVPAVVTTNTLALHAFDLEGRSLWAVDMPIDAIELVVAPGVVVASNYEGELAVFAFSP